MVSNQATDVAHFLITGVAGFIGSHLAEALIARGDEVRGIDNFATGKPENVPAGVEFRQTDLRDANAVTSACEGIDFILHQAALPSVPRSVEDPRTSHEVNLNGTFNVLEGARAAGVRRVIFAASSSAYGNQPGFPRVETMTPMPIAPYPVQKVACELYMQSYWKVYGIETVCLRYFNIFGPRQDPSSQYSGVMARFILQMLRGDQPVIFGDGEQGRDFTYVENVVSANLLACAAPTEAAAGRIFNIACGERHTLNETFRELAQLTGFPSPAKYAPDRAGDVKNSLADIGAAQSALGYEVKVGLREGLQRTVNWYREQFRG